MRQVENWSRQVATQLQVALQMVAPPQPPPIALLDPSSQHYAPDTYHLQRAQYEQRMQSWEATNRHVQQISQQAEQIASAQREQHERAELDRLSRVWPEFSKQEIVQSFISDMGKFYGYSEAELDASMNDHRNALVARDAIAYRKLKAGGGELRAKAVAKAPAKAAQPKGSGRTLSREEAQHMQARKALKASGGKDRAAAARAFMKFV
jgi:hypothetical protein